MKTVTNQNLSPADKADLWSGRDYWRTKDKSDKGFPAIRVSDGPHGLRMIKDQSQLWDRGAGKSICYPTASLMSATFNRELIGRVGAMLGEEARSIGVHILLGPGMNLKRSPLCGRNFEYYSEDPYLSAEMAIAFVGGVQSRGVGACIKHFACNNQEYERMSTSAEVDERTLRELYLYHFERAVKEAKPWAVMCAYNKINGTFCSENSRLLTDILKREWGFDGIVISDWTAVVDPVKSLNAGVDLEMPGTGGYSEQLVLQAFEKGEITEEKLDETNRRLALTVSRALASEHGTGDFDREKAIALACEAAEEGIVLLKNEENMLPLDPVKYKSAVLVGAFAKNPRIQGGGSSRVTAAGVETAAEQLEKLCPKIKFKYEEGYSLEETESADLIPAAVKAAAKADAAIVFVGLPASYEEEGYDRKHMDLPAVHVDLVRRIAEVQPKTAVVLICGSAVVVEPFADKVRSILFNGLAGQGGGLAMARILCGLVNPSGKLSESFPLRYLDNPSALNYPGEDRKVVYGERQFIGYRSYEKRNLEVRFPFGHGLSYTDFMYSGLELGVDADGVDVRFKLTNTGRSAGKETVQVYVGDMNPALARPVKELKAFEKIHLDAGESKDIVLRVPLREFAYYDDRIMAWRVRPGWYGVHIGSSSSDIRLKDKVQLNPKTPKLPVTGETYLAELREDKEAWRLFKKTVGIIKFKVAFENPANIMLKLMYNSPLRAIFTQIPGLNRRKLGQFLAKVNHGESSDDK